MNFEEYEVMYQVEDHHWWYLGMEQHHLPGAGALSAAVEIGVKDSGRRLRHGRGDEVSVPVWRSDRV